MESESDETVISDDHKAVKPVPTEKQTKDTDAPSDAELRTIYTQTVKEIEKLLAEDDVLLAFFQKSCPQLIKKSGDGWGVSDEVRRGEVLIWKVLQEIEDNLPVLCRCRMAA